MSGLEWPQGFERTSESNRTRNRNYQATLGATTSDLATEMDRLDPEHWRASIGNQHTKSNSLPRHNANPSDPGFVLRWTKDGEQFAVACDAYSRLRDNVRTVYLWVHETRLRGQRPVETGESEFAAARLPPADEDVIVADAGRAAHDVLDVDSDARPNEIRTAYRERVKEAHPDNGGSTAEFRRVREAREVMLDE